jgi:hypothetical protein
MSCRIGEVVLRLRLLRIPLEDRCQALSIPPALKYESDGGPGIESILRLLRGSDSPQEDQRTFLKAVIVFWLLGATEGHAKNFSVFLSPGGRYRMTPLYGLARHTHQVSTKKVVGTSRDDSSARSRGELRTFTPNPPRRAKRRTRADPETHLLQFGLVERP